MLVQYLKTIIDFRELSREIMSEFSEEIFEKKLSELRDSQKEIQSLSQYCVHNRQNCKIVVKVTILLSSFMMVEMVILIYILIYI